MVGCDASSVGDLVFLLRPKTSAKNGTSFPFTTLDRIQDRNERLIDRCSGLYQTLVEGGSFETPQVYRAYNPTMGRWISRDPIGESGGINLYGYVENNPTDLTDPLGLLTVAVIGAGTDSNPFGHASLAFSGSGIYSFGTGRDFQLGSSFTDFLAKQSSYRDNMLYVLPTTPEQERAMKDYLNRLPHELPDVPSKDSSDNCASRTNDALKKGGIDLGATPLPASTQRGLEDLIRRGQGTRFSLPQGGQINPVWQLFNPPR